MTEINFKGLDARARFDGDIELILICAKDTQNSVQGLLDEFKADARWSAKIAKIKRKRSLEANSYCWILCDKIADKLNTTKEAVYQEAIKSVGVFTQLLVEDVAVESFIKCWNSQGVGNHAMVAYGSKKNPGNTVIVAYHGSSTYDSKQMARLIDYIVQEAKDLGVETMAPSEIERMKNTWK